MSKKISALIVFGLCASLFYWSELKLEQLVEINSIAIVFGSLFPIVFVLARNGAAHWSESMVALGVPLGPLGGTIGVTGILRRHHRYERNECLDGWLQHNLSRDRYYVSYRFVWWDCLCAGVFRNRWGRETKQPALEDQPGSSSFSIRLHCALLDA